MGALLQLPRGVGYLVGLVGNQQGVRREVVQQPAAIEETRVKALLLYLLPLHKQIQFAADARLRLGIAVAYVHRRDDALKLGAVGERGQDFVRGRHVYGVHHVGGSLRSGIEQADAVNLAAPELDAGGHIRADGEYVQDAAAPAHKAGRIDGAFELIAHAPPQV